MDKVAVVIPNYNGYRYLETCFAALAKQTFTEFTTYFVDNGSQDESCAFLREHYPETKIIQLDDNYGFSRAVNEGIRQSKEPYVILLNNDTEVSRTLSSAFMRESVKERMRLHAAQS
ncbi:MULTISPECIES: glycosyltransferase [unclassified Blautia]|uniref:glycosyltransferase n=1 Tax=unclassified Blautia TaxID=2648079 RepID=UPI00267EC3C8|nr:glycosyltransferase [Blautia sp. OF11-22]